jgi:hypothetical protein
MFATASLKALVRASCNSIGLDVRRRSFGRRRDDGFVEVICSSGRASFRHVPNLQLRRFGERAG